MFMPGVFATFARCASGFKLIGLLALVAACGGAFDTALAAARISALDSDSCAISSDGRVQCWGNASAYQGAGAGRAMDLDGFPPDLVGLAGVNGALCVLTAGSGLLCQGNWPGNGSSVAATPVAPVGMDADVVDVARSAWQTCAVKADGSVWCWGHNAHGLGDGVSTQSLVPVEVLPPAFAAAGVSVGWQHVCAWGQSGQARCWGNNQNGQLGHGVSGGSEAQPVAVIGLTTVQAMTAGYSHTCALVAGGAIYCWGDNGYRQLGDNSYTHTSTPVLATMFGSANQGVFAANSFTCAQDTSGVLRCEGASFYRQTAASGLLQADARQVAVAGGHGCALVDGRAHCWGDNELGQTGNGRFGNEYSPVKLLNGGFAQAPGVAFDQGCAARQDGSVTCWGDSFVLPPYDHEPVAGVGGLAQYVGKGSRHKCLLRDDAKVLCWGWNYNGMLGDGTTDFRLEPTLLAGITQNVTQLSVGVEHSCAVLADTSVVCWGRNQAGQAGSGDFQNRLTPGPVAGLSDIVQVSAGWAVSCALAQSGEIWCWGTHENGLLGTGGSAPTAVPVQIQGLPAPARQLSVGFAHACAVLQDDRIACWGSGQLGDGGYMQSPVPVVVASSESFEQVVASLSHSCARNVAGEVFCWGSPWRGQLGTGPENRNVLATIPRPVALQAVDLAAAPDSSTTCALDAQGDAWCWGANEYAQLGIGRRGVREVPGPVMGMGEDIFSNGFEP